MSLAKRERDRMMSKAQLATYPKKIISELIEIYKNSPCLWKVKSEEYFDRAKKDRAYSIIVDKFQEVEQFPNRQMAISFFSALRFYYRKQLRLVEQGKKPTLWYFNQLDFIREYLFSNRKVNSLEIIVNSSPQMDSPKNNENDIECSSPLNMENSMNSDVSCVSSSQRKTSNLSPENELEEENEDEYYHENEHVLEPEYEDLSMVDIVDVPSSQYFEDLGKTWANLLRSISPQQQVIAEKLINDIIYEAHMEKLDDQVPVDIFNVLQTCN